jgi:hypothetical protein
MQDTAASTEQNLQLKCCHIQSHLGVAGDRPILDGAKVVQRNKRVRHG